MSVSSEEESPLGERQLYLVSFLEESELLLISNCSRWKDLQIIGCDNGNNLLSTLKKLNIRNSKMLRAEVGPGSDLPGWFSLQITGSSSVSFDVPLLPMPDSEHYVEGICFGVVFTASDESSAQSVASLAIIISNKTNGLEWTHRPTIPCILATPEDYVFQTYIPRRGFGCPIKGGDQLEVSFIVPPVMEVKKCGIHAYIDTLLASIGSNFASSSE